VLDELSHRVRNFLQTFEAVAQDTQSTSVEDYRTTLMAGISGLASLRLQVAVPRCRSSSLTVHDRLGLRRYSMLREKGFTRHSEGL
jgi:HWE histidine kinase